MNYYGILISLLFLYMSIWFLISLQKKRNDITDVAWGLGFTLMAWTSFLISDGVAGLRGLFVCVLVSIWGLRLAWHIYNRNKNKTEDYRYLTWRKDWGKWFYLRSYFQVYLLQGMFLFLIIFPVLLINKSNESTFGILDFIGLIIWIFGFYFEVVGDAQLAKFIKNPENKGKLLTSGLWSYTRHPNYFGEVTQWWGLWFIALPVAGGWIGIIGPLTITFLILKVSGIPLLEKKMEENPDFAKYKKRVSVFLPMLPRR